MTAAATGKVVAARPVVVIEHIVLDGHDKRRVRSRYGRLSRVDVRVGQIVRRGAVIGAAGNWRGAAVRHPFGRQSESPTPARSSARTRGCPIRRRRSSWC